MNRNDRPVARAVARNAPDDLVRLVIAVCQPASSRSDPATHYAAMTSLPTIVACTSLTKLILHVSVLLAMMS